MAVTALLRVEMNVADLGRAERFYRDGLGFERDGSNGAVTLMRLGAQRIGLRAASGAPYPAGSTAADPWFQHIAIVVRDMTDGYAHLGRAGAITPISHGGPVRLPQSSGSVTAFKFRDPDGNPLELIEFPRSTARWRDAAGLFLGIDHTAIVVADVEASIAFYTGKLGLSVGGRSVNTGAEQQHLDGLPEVTVDVVALKPGQATPHVELLAYRTPRVSERATIGPDDIAATRTVLRGDAAELAATEDPDAHRLLIL